MYKIKNLKSFTQFLNEFELEGEVHGKPLWNGIDYLDKDGDIRIENTNLTGFPCIFPEKWDKGFWCKNNQLTSLIGAPKEVGGDFYCDNNKLTSLEGAPKEVGGSFWCRNNQLTSLKGAPEKVGKGFWCYNNNLTSLQGAPREVGGNFKCYNNKLTSLEGAPKEVRGSFYCYNNNNKFTEEDVRKVSQVKGDIYV